MNWLSELHLRIAANYKILWGELIHCGTVEFLKTLALCLLCLIGTKLVLHSLYLWRLRAASPPFNMGKHPRLARVYHTALEKAGLHTRYLLHQYQWGPYLAFTVGILQPAIFLAPRIIEELDDEELEAILVHELHHIKRKDNLKIWLYDLAGALVPILTVAFFGIYFVVSVRNSLIATLATILALFIFFFLLKRIFSRLREQTCDDLTVKSTGNPLALASSLIKAWEFIKDRETRWRRMYSAGHHILRGRSCLEGRVHRLVKYRKPWGLMLLSQSVRITLWSILFLTAIFLFRFHVAGSYEGVRLQFETSEEGCVHLRRDGGQNCQISFEAPPGFPDSD